MTATATPDELTAFADSLEFVASSMAPAQQDRALELAAWVRDYADILRAADPSVFATGESECLDG